MKKNSLVLTAVCSLLAVVMHPVESRSDDPAGKVLTVRKKVQVVRDEEKQKALPQMDLEMKDAVETDKKSRTKLFFTDDSILNLGELSRVVVEEYIYSPEKQKSKSIYRLVDGTMKVIVGRSDLEIHTSTAVVAARGTTIIAWEKDDESCAAILDGSALIKNRNEKIKGEEEILAGMMSCVPLMNPPEPQYEATPAILQKVSSVNTVMGTVSEKSTRAPEQLPMPASGDQGSTGQGSSNQGTTDQGTTKGIVITAPQQVEVQIESQQVPTVPPEPDPEPDPPPPPDPDPEPDPPPPPPPEPDPEPDKGADSGPERRAVMLDLQFPPEMPPTTMVHISIVLGGN